MRNVRRTSAEITDKLEQREKNVVENRGGEGSHEWYLVETG